MAKRILPQRKQTLDSNIWWLIIPEMKIRENFSLIAFRLSFFCKSTLRKSKSILTFYLTIGFLRILIVCISKQLTHIWDLGLRISLCKKHLQFKPGISQESQRIQYRREGCKNLQLAAKKYQKYKVGQGHQFQETAGQVP